jgi:predicted DCC family thiol-disulfide oxidoreductase YuxK
MIERLAMPFTTASVNPGSSNTESSPTWQVKLLYDGACPLCLREVDFLTRRDAGRGLVAFVDIAADDYRSEDNGGIDFERAMGRIHAITADGNVLKNVEVFRYIYSVLGMGWVYAATRWPVIGPIVDRAYAIWADWRLPLTGRPSLATVVAEREERLGRCRLEK